MNHHGSDAVCDETTRSGEMTGDHDIEQMTSDRIYDTVLPKPENKGELDLVINMRTITLQIHPLN